MTQQYMFYAMYCIPICLVYADRKPKRNSQVVISKCYILIRTVTEE